MKVVMLAVLAAVSCKPPEQSPPPVQIGRPPPIAISEPRPRDQEEGNSWSATAVWDAGATPEGGATTIVAPRPGRCPTGSLFREGACVIQTVHCPEGSTKTGGRCLGAVVCPGSSQWDGSACRPVAEPAPAAASSPAGQLAACTLQINSIPVTTVLVDGNLAGPTPRIGVVVPAGTHTVLFLHETLGKKVVTVSCAAGEHKSVAVKIVP